MLLFSILLLWLIIHCSPFVGLSGPSFIFISESGDRGCSGRVTPEPPELGGGGGEHEGSGSDDGDTTEDTLAAARNFSLIKAGR